MYRMFDTSVFDRRVLSNGIRVYQQRSPIKVSDAGVLITNFANCGSIADPVGRNGTNHFFEHIIFRGTENLPDKVAMLSPVERKGGEVSATTGLTYVNYQIKAPMAEYPLAVDTLFEMAFRPCIRDEDAVAERGGIKSEFLGKMGDGKYVAFSTYFSELFGKHPYGHFPIGRLEVIESMTGAELRAVQEDQHHAGNLNIICGGTFAERDDMIGLLEEKFGRAQLKEPLILPDRTLLPLGKSGEIDLYNPKLSRDHLVIAYPLAPTNTSGRISLEILAKALAGSLISPLMLRIREELGLTYESGPVWLDEFRDIWTFTAFLAVPEQTFERVRTIFFDEMEKFDASAILEAKQTIQCKRRCEFITPIAAAGNLGKSLAIFPENYPAAYEDEITDGISPDEVLALRDELLDKSPFICRIRK